MVAGGIVALSLVFAGTGATAKAAEKAGGPTSSISGGLSEAIADGIISQGQAKRVFLKRANRNIVNHKMSNHRKNFK